MNVEHVPWDHSLQHTTAPSHTHTCWLLHTHTMLSLFPVAFPNDSCQYSFFPECGIFSYGYIACSISTQGKGFKASDLTLPTLLRCVRATWSQWIGQNGEGTKLFLLCLFVFLAEVDMCCHTDTKSYCTHHITVVTIFNSNITVITIKSYFYHPAVVAGSIH